MRLSDVFCFSFDVSWELPDLLWTAFHRVYELQGYFHPSEQCVHTINYRMQHRLPAYSCRLNL